MVEVELNDYTIVHNINNAAINESTITGVDPNKYAILLKTEEPHVMEGRLNRELKIYIKG